MIVSAVAHRKPKFRFTALPETAASDRRDINLNVHFDINGSARRIASREKEGEIILTRAMAGFVSRIWLREPLRGGKPL